MDYFCRRSLLASLLAVLLPQIDRITTSPAPSNVSFRGTKTDRKRFMISAFDAKRTSANPTNIPI
jgi:hypothetical protein